MIVRKARLKDAPIISKVMRDTIKIVNSKDYSADKLNIWLNTNRITKIKERTKDTNKINFVAVIHNKVVGVASLYFKEKELGSLYVKHDTHEKGIGTKLLQYVEEYAKKKGLKELKLGSTITALDFYKNRGYKTTKKKHNVILQGVRIPCILMSKRL